MKTRLDRGTASSILSAVGACALLALASFAEAQTCEHSISACGCTIRKPGTYTVTGPLNIGQGVTRRNDCIDISASRVLLLLGGNDIEGPGSASAIRGKKKVTLSAIRVLPGAASVSVIGSTPTGANATIREWDIAVHVQGNRFFGEGITATLNQGAAVLLDKSRNSIIASVNAVMNDIGIEIRGGRSNQITDFDSYGNVTFGVWITNSVDNTIQNGDVEDNTGTGVYLGCSETGPGDTKCAGGAVKHNRIFNNLLDDNLSYGIALDRNALGTVVAENVAYDSDTDDLFDGRTNCDKNNWINNDYTTSNQTCIK